MKKINLIEWLSRNSHEKQSPQRFARYAVMLILLVMCVAHAWAYNEYNKRYLYIDATACTWFTNDGGEPNLNIYDEYACTTWKAYQESPNGTLDTRIWYFDLTFYDYWEYSRGFKTQRHAGSYWGTQCQAGYVDGDTKNCLIYASDANSVSWGYYRPAMSSASVVDNGTEKTGSGTSLSPYQVVTGSTIYLSASCVSAVDDPSMTKEYKFWNKGSQLRAYSSTNTYSFTAGAAGTTYEITVTAQNTYQSGSGTESPASTTLYYTVIAAPEPSITALAVSAADVYSGEGSLTLTATRNAAAAGINIQYQVKVPGGSWTNIGEAVNLTTKSYSPTNGHGTYEFRAYPVGYGSNYTDASKDVYEHWNIYVHDVQGWGKMSIYSHTAEAHGNWPGTACSKYNGSNSWYEVTLDSKSTKFILNKNGEKSGGSDIKTSDLTTGTSSGTYAAGTYWYINSNTDGTLVSVSVTNPTVNLSASVANCKDITLNGSVTNFGGDGTKASDMKEVYFQVGGAKQDATTVSSSTGNFSKTISSASAGAINTLQAFATNIHGTGSSSTLYYTNVTLNQQGGADGTTSVTAVENTAMPAGASAPTRTGYTFGGYYASTGGEGKQYYTNTMTSANAWDQTTKDATIHAKWIANPYTITLKKHNGGSDGSVSVTFDANTGLTSDVAVPTKIGYTFAGYWTGEGGTGTKLADGDGKWQKGNAYISAGGNWVNAGNVTLHAAWDANEYKIYLQNYDPSTHGTLEECVWPDPENPYLEVTFGTDNLKCHMNPESLPLKLPYKFSGWYSGEAGSGDQIFDYIGGMVDVATVYTDASGNWKQASDVTVYAKWFLSSVSPYLDIIVDNNVGTGGAITAVYKADALESFTASIREGYIFQGYYTAAEGGNKIINADGTLVANVGSYTDADHKWIYAGSTPTIHAQWVPITYTIAFAKNNDPSYYGSETGDNPTPIAATYDVNATMPENTYSRTGYHFIGWSTEAHKAKGSCTGVDYDYAAGGTARNLTSTQGATVTLYPKWLGNTYTISFNARGGYVSQTSSNITFDETYGSGTGLSGNLPIPTPPSGYEFSGWYTASEGGTEVTKDDKMHTDGDHTLYAHYVRKDRVYFKNTLGWENVYVTWDAEWNHGGSDKGAGASGKTQELMNHIYGTDIWYKDIPAAVLSSWKYNIAFTSESMPNYEWFSRGEAVFRRDFDKKATMFVPVPNDPRKFLKNNEGGNPGTLYYSTDQIVDKSGDVETNYRYKNGYWTKYNDLQAGYDLKGSWDDWEAHHYIERSNPNDSVYIFTLQGLNANTTYEFKLWKDVETNSYSSVFSSTTSITSATAPDAAIFNAANGGSNASMKTTVAGDYTFKFNFSALGEVKLTVDYPFAVNDYKVVYSYTKDGAKTFESQYIKARANGIDTISMFIHSGDSATSRSLAIHKCTTINASGVATWNTSYASIALPTETASGKTSGVYNIRISQNESSAATGECVGRYEGQYYIRSQAADGGWDQYKVHADNLMTLSEYSLKQTLSAPYSHYFCKYIDNSTTEVTFTIATDYSPSICPVMVGDETIGDLANKTLPEGKSASVRFMWNMETNATGRSYLKSAQGSQNARFLVLHGAADDMIFNNDATGTDISASGDLAKNEKIFEDTENWVYECYIKAKPGAKVSLIAKYNTLDRYLIGGPSSWETIIGGTGESKYTMKVVYDFKTNRLMTAWVPSEGITEKLSNIDVIIERHNQDGATTITFKKATEESEAGSIEAKSVIGALRFDYDELVGRVASWTTDTRAKMMFLVSFPFDVNISDIFGLNTNYGEAFVVQKYNGAKRAEKGFFQLDGTDTFWEDLPVDSVMHAGVGYCVCMDNEYLNNDVGHLWDNKKAGSSIYLYFPSANGDIVINSDAKTIHVPAHECKINRTFNGGKLNHKYTDSNWNMMGIPIFQNHTGDKDVAGTPGAIFTPNKEVSDTTDYMPGIGFFYEWSTDKSYSVRKAEGYEFKPMHGYLVQYAGDVTFTCATPDVAAPVAARRTPVMEDYELELQVLNTNEEVLNRTYVELREEACDTFALNEDLYLAMNKHAVNVYTFAGTYNVAANVLSVDNHIVPMGVVVRKEGTYTFSMPDNFSGEVTLVDTHTGTRTNLAMTDYEIHLQTGTFDERFYLEININMTPTAIDGVTDGSGSLKDGKAHKFIMNDMLYILKDGVIYDARGNRVQ